MSQILCVINIVCQKYCVSKILCVTNIVCHKYCVSQILYVTNIVSHEHHFIGFVLAYIINTANLK